MLKRHPLILSVLVGGTLFGSGVSADAQEVMMRPHAHGSEIVWTGGSTPVSLHTTANQVLDLQVQTWDQVVATTWQEKTGRGEVLPYYRLSVDGGQSFGRVRQTSYDLKLRYAQFDPLQAEPKVISELQARPGHELYLVQYMAQGTEAWRDAIRSLGGVDHRFMANHANIWRMDSHTAAAVEELPFVRWVGAFHPAYKLENELLDAFYTGTLETRSYNLVVGEWGPAEKAILAENIQALGGDIERNINEGWIVQAFLTPAQLTELIHTSEVLGIDRKGEPEKDMAIVRDLMGGDYIHGLGWDGTGVRAEVMDDGLDIGNSAWRYAPLVHGSVGFGSHGTSTYSINFSEGPSSTHGGLCPDAQGIIASYLTFGNRYTHTAALLSPPYEAVYQSNSWGDPRTTNYTSVSQEMDDIILINDIVITQSQSNAGNQFSRPQAWAKNIVGVGGIRHYGNTNNDDDNWNFGASTGPAEDGRVKPDMSAFYDSIYTVNNSGFGGTSAASPIVAGHFGLFHEMWHAGIFGNSTGATVFDSRPHSTTARAMLINTAWQWPDDQTDITRFRQGWGRPDVRFMYDNRNNMLIIDESDVLTNLQSTTYNVNVPSGSEFRATLVYLDVAGTTSSSQHRINDLTLLVTDPSGNQYWGNNGLINGSYNYSTTGGTSNDLDCVENVFVEFAQAGTWTVEVIADEINQDSHTETGGVDADYALVVTAAQAPPCGDSIILTGPASANAGSTVTYNYANADSNSSFWMLYSFNDQGSVINGQCFNIGPGVVAAGSGTTTATGSGSWTSGTIPGAAANKTVYIEMMVINGANQTVDSNHLQLDIL